MSIPHNHLYEFGPFMLDVHGRLLLRDGEPVALAPRAFDVLVVLVQNRGRLISKDDLMKAVRGDTVVEEGNLSLYISSIRKALGDSAAEPRYVQTVPRQGYRFIALVRGSVSKESKPEAQRHWSEGTHTLRAVGQGAIDDEASEGIYPGGLKVIMPETGDTLLNNEITTIPVKAKANKTRDPYRLNGIVLNGRYSLIDYAGSGGMGAVYRAMDTELRRIVAVKILKPDVVARSSEYAELFEREAKNVQSLDHPHIVKIFDSGKDEDLSYMVMEWVEGLSIEDILTQGQLPLDRLTNIFEQICDAVAFAHERNIIHLDLKPGNILLLDRPESDDFAKVIDFGLSRVISKESGTTMTNFRGTHLFCAPEQFGRKVSHKSDIYSLGATLYYLLTGVIPFGASYINAKIHPNLELPEIPSVVRQRSLPQAVDHVLRKALSKDPALRQQSAKELFQEFREAVSATPEAPEHIEPLAGNSLPSIQVQARDRSQRTESFREQTRDEKEAIWKSLEANFSQKPAEANTFEQLVIGTLVTFSLLVLIGLAIYPSATPAKGIVDVNTSSAGNNSPFDFLKAGSTITGRITTPRGVGVSGLFVTVSLKVDKPGPKLRVSTTTDDRGVYYLTNLEAGQYDMELYKLNYASKMVTGLSIPPNSAITQNISLQPSDINPNPPRNVNRRAEFSSP